jgi:hypothetical protein
MARKSIPSAGLCTRTTLSEHQRVAERESTVRTASGEEVATYELPIVDDGEPWRTAVVGGLAARLYRMADGTGDVYVGDGFNEPTAEQLARVAPELDLPTNWRQGMPLPWHMRRDLHARYGTRARDTIFTREMPYGGNQISPVIVPADDGVLDINSELDELAQMLDEDVPEREFGAAVRRIAATLEGAEDDEDYPPARKRAPSRSAAASRVAAKLTPQTIEKWLKSKGAQRSLGQKYEQAIQGLYTALDENYNDDIGGANALALNQIIQGISYAVSRMGGDEYKVLRAMTGKELVALIADLWNQGVRTIYDTKDPLIKFLRKDLASSVP